MITVNSGRLIQFITIRLLMFFNMIQNWNLNTDLESYLSLRILIESTGWENLNSRTIFFSTSGFESSRIKTRTSHYQNIFTQTTTTQSKCVRSPTRFDGKHFSMINQNHTTASPFKQLNEQHTFRNSRIQSTSLFVK